MKLENKQGITNITFKPKAVCFCPLGDDWYTNEFEIFMSVGEWFPDYCDIEKYLNENIRGKSLIIEDATRSLYNHINAEYKPGFLEVISRVNDAASHSPVEVKIV